MYSMCIQQVVIMLYVSFPGATRQTENRRAYQSLQAHSSVQSAKMFVKKQLKNSENYASQTLNHRHTQLLAFHAVRAAPIRVVGSSRR